MQALLFYFIFGKYLHILVGVSNSQTDTSLKEASYFTGSAPSAFKQGACHHLGPASVRTFGLTWKLCLCAFARDMRALANISV